MKRIYLDNAAATPIDSRVVSAMVGASKIVGNPSSVAGEGRRAAQALSTYRATTARFLHASPGEVVFTASGSEANTLAILGLVETLGSGTWNIISAPTEHLSVLRALDAARKQGIEVRMLGVDTQGNIDVEELARVIDRRTALVSLMYANNEIGTIHPIAAWSKVIRSIRKKNNSPYPYLHTDACQASAWLPMDVQNLGVDLLTFNGAKMCGPRGTGVLFVRRGTPLQARVVGGDQEHGFRAGTEDLVSIAGVSRAIALVRPTDARRVARLRNELWSLIQQVVADARLNGPVVDLRLANNLSVSFPGVDGEALVLELDRRGIAVSAGSACTAQASGASHVLTAIGVPGRYRAGAIRFSLSRHTTRKEITAVAGMLPAAIERVRRRRA